MHQDKYEGITIGGGDTSQPLSLQKRLAFIQSQVQLSGLRFLDCGCGAGAYVLALHEAGADAQGIEYSQDKVAAFLAKGRETHRVRQGDLESIPFPSAVFDAALLNEVLEHVPNDRQALAEVFRVLKPGGRLFIFSPNRWFPFETHGTTLQRPKISLPPCTPFVPYIPIPLGNRIFNYHARNYFQRELIRLVSGVGFQVIDRSWIWQTFENISGRQPRWIRWSCSPRAWRSTASDRAAAGAGSTRRAWIVTWAGS